MIAKVHDNVYDIKYDDGDEELRVDPKYIQRVGTKRPPRVVAATRTGTRKQGCRRASFGRSRRLHRAT